MSTRADLIALAEEADDMPAAVVVEELARLTPGLSVERRKALWRNLREATWQLADVDFNPAEALWKYAAIESSCPVEAQRLRDQATADRDWALMHLTVITEAAA